MNNQVTTSHCIAREIDFSQQLFCNYFFPQRVTIISTRALRRHCIVLREVNGQRKIVRFNFSIVNVVTVETRDRNLPKTSTANQNQ